MMFNLFPRVACLKTLLLSLLFIGTSFVVHAQAPFITVWQTDNPGTSNNNQITIPGTGTSYSIEWEEVGNEANNNGSETGTDEHTITFPSAGTYRVKIDGDFTQITFNNAGDKSKIIDIEQWGEIEWTSFESAFYGCNNLVVIEATDAPDLTNVTNLEEMFRNASLFNSAINHWNVSTIVNMKYMFYGCDYFNQDLNSWNVSNVQTMQHMFNRATRFNGNISSWNTSKVTVMAGMFVLARAFNQDIGGWDVSKVTSFNSMFTVASNFNQDIGQWDVSSGLQFYDMFDEASKFNQDISGWNLVSATAVGRMFSNATSFDQNLGSWDISGISSMYSMFRSSGLSVANYENTLLGWSNLATVPTGISLGAEGLRICDLTGRSKLINDKGWTISGDRLTENCGGVPFISIWKTDNPGSSNNNQIILPLTGDYLVYWEDVTNNSKYGFASYSGTSTINFPSAGTYKIEISSDLERIEMNNIGDKSKLLSIEQWGDISWTSFENAFYGCNNLVYNATDRPNLTNVSSLRNAFKDASNFDANIGSWDISNITNMEGMLDNSSLTKDNYDLTLANWNQQATTPSSITLGALNIDYCLSTARAALINDKNWTINGDIDNCTIPFVTIWKTDNAGSSEDNQITIPAVGAYKIKWVEVGNETNTAVFNSAGSTTITFPTKGTYRIEIYDGLERIIFDDSGDRLKILNIAAWGDVAWTSFEDAFSGCENLTYSASDSPDLSNVLSLNEMFSEAIQFNGDIGNWDVSSVQNMYRMFYGATTFNQDLNNWDVSNVTNISEIFHNASSFNGNITNWDVGNVTIFVRMFRSASNFNQDISNWDTSSGRTFEQQFFLASSFNFNLGNWDISAAENMNTMLSYSGLSQSNYQSTLNGWAQLTTVPSNITLGSTSLDYCVSSGREALINDKNWSINGDRTNCGIPFITLWQTDNTGVSADNEIIIPAVGGPYKIEWEEVGNLTNSGSQIGTGQTTVIFPSAGQFRVKLSGELGQIQFNNTGDKDKIVAIEQWGEVNWTSLDAAFMGCTNLSYSATDAPDLSSITELTDMFSGASSFDGDLSAWNIQGITNMAGMLDNTSLSDGNYGQTLSAWANQANVPSDITLGVSGLTYCESNGRSNLVNDYNWSFIGDTDGCADPFITIWKTDNLGYSADDQLTIPGIGSYSVKWEEVGNESNYGFVSGTDEITIDFPTPGTYRLKMYGDLERVNFSMSADRAKLIELVHWGNVQWTSFQYAFYQCSNMTYSATDAPDLSNVTDLSYMFTGANAFNGAIDNWDVSTITNMNYMFNNADGFNQDLNSWDVSKVTEMKYMFAGADVFNGGIENWNVTRVSDLSFLFAGTPDFNQNISSWDMSGARNMRYMFYEAIAFNQDLSAWDLSSAENMEFMFTGASSFDQSLGSWDISSVTNMSSMLNNSGMSVNNYQGTLDGWAQLATVPLNISLGAVGMEYCITDGRGLLINDKNWFINGDNENCGVPFVTVWTTDNIGISGNNEILLPLIGGPYKIEWEEIDNTANSGSQIGSGQTTLTFPSEGTYRVSLSGGINQIQFNNTGDKAKIVEVEQWGEIAWTSFNAAFEGCENLVYNATDNPDLSALTDLGNMFSGAASFNANLGSWDISTITTMTGMLDNTGFSEENYDLTLQSWYAQANTPMNITLGAAGLSYCVSQGRFDLVNEKNWVIDGDSESCGAPFTTVWKTDNPGNSAVNEIVIPAVGTYRIKWEEVGNETNNGIAFGSNSTSLTFPSSGTYRIQIYGDLEQINFANSNDNEKIITIEQWGDIAWTSFESAFFNCDSLTYSATDAPDLSQVTTMSSMFDNAYAFNGAINNWDVSNVTDMTYMFRNAESFNQDLNTWNVSSITSLYNIFEGAVNFNGDISNWDVSNVTSFSNAFNNAVAFNQDISSWDLSSARFVRYMFAGAVAFNQDISGWDLSIAEEFEYMFSGATTFDQNLGGWNISQANDMTGMLGNAGISESNYTETLNGWGNLTTVPTAISLGAEGLDYCAAVGRIFLVEEKAWIISGDKNVCTEPFVTTWKTDNPGASANNQITISGTGNNYRVAWEEVGDATNTGFVRLTNTNVLTLPKPGTYKIEINGDFSRINFSNNGDRNKLVEISQWGEIAWTSFESAFFNCDSLTYTATDAPDLSQVTSMSRMFDNAYAFNGAIDNWDVSNVTDITYMFRNAESFNQDLNNWNVSSVTSLYNIFDGATNFNGDISNWDVSNVGSFSNVFRSAVAFNQDISSWNLASARFVRYMFAGASSFNQDISGWNLSIAEEFEYMFSGATAFNQNLGGWNVSKAIDMTGMLDYAGMTESSYTETLQGWSSQTNIPESITLGAAGIAYCGASGRNTLVDQKNWIIVGDIENCGLPFVTIWKTDNPSNTTNNNQIRIPGEGSNYKIEWEEVNNAANNGSVIASNYHTLTLPNSGTYRIAISGNFNRINFSNSGDLNKIIEITQWGEIAWTSFESAFFNCDSLTYTATDAPDLSQVTTMSSMFDNAYAFNGAIDNWDVSNVTDMTYMFRNAESFNQDLNNWNVSSVTSLYNIFEGATNFNGDISNWDVSNVGSFSNVFKNAVAFNQDISSWNLASARFVRYMFAGANSFNQDISGWDLSLAEEFEYMFSGATAFNQNLGGWNISQANDMTGMLGDVGISSENYDSLLNGWSQLNNLPTDINLGANNLVYCSGASGRNILTSQNNWSIIGDSPCQFEILDTYPEADSENVELDTDIYVVFSSNIFELNFNNISISGRNSNKIAIDNITISSDTLKIKLGESLAPDTKHSVSILGNSVENVAGQPNSVISWSFLTANQLPTSSKKHILSGGTKVFPNPFDDYVNITFELNKTSEVKLYLYDLKGQLVKQVNYNTLNAGEHNLTLQRGKLLKGLYNYRLQVDNQFVSGKLMVK